MIVAGNARGTPGVDFTTVTSGAPIHICVSREQIFFTSFRQTLVLTRQQA